MGWIKIFFFYGDGLSSRALVCPRVWCQKNFTSWGTKGCRVWSFTRSESVCFCLHNLPFPECLMLVPTALLCVFRSAFTVQLQDDEQKLRVFPSLWGHTNCSNAGMGLVESDMSVVENRVRSVCSGSQVADRKWSSWWGWWTICCWRLVWMSAQRSWGRSHRLGDNRTAVF